MITCPECGHPNDPFRLTCERCKAKLSANPKWAIHDDGFEE